MAAERLLGNAGLLAVSGSGAIAPDNRMLGYNWRTDLPNKVITNIYVKMPPAATQFAAGTRVQIWKRATPIGDSVRLQNIDIGGGIVTGAAGSEQPVPGVANTALVQNDFYFVTIFQPFNHGGNYWFNAPGGSPGTGSMSGNCIFRNTGSGTLNPEDLPPDDETFTGGRFAVDVEINDVSTDINATLAIVLPPIGLNLAVAAQNEATLNITLPPVQAGLSATESVLYDNLREYVWNTLRNDGVLNGYGINGDSIFAANALDSPAANLQRWVALRWSIEDAPLGRDTTSRRRPLIIWAYDRERDYTFVDLILQRCQQILYPIAAVQYSIDGWITQVERGNTSDDLFDAAYNAVARSWDLTIVASGL